MSFTSDIRDFSKGRLRSTTTNVTHLDGSKWLETRPSDEHGYVVSRSLDDSSNTGYGYVLDVIPDLQIGWILPNLLLGSVDVACDHSLLKENEVTHILNVASFNTQFAIDRGPGYCAVNGLFIYKHVSIMDLPDTDIISYFDECFAFIESALDTGGRILVHCMAGVSRAASIVIGYLMKVKDMDFQTAFNHVKAKRPSIRPNDGFMHQLQNYGYSLEQQKHDL